MAKLFGLAKGIIAHYGYTGIFALTFGEQFLLPIPSDFYAVIGVSFGLEFAKSLAFVLLGAFLGSCVGYFLGKFIGHPLLLKLLGQKKVDHGEHLIKKWGIWGIIVAGLLPIPEVYKIAIYAAGIFEMPFLKFLLGVVLGRLPRFMLTAYAGSFLLQTKIYASTQMSALVLGLVQGLTQFIPVSSSGHLILLEHFLHLPLNADKLAIFDIFVNGASFFAIIIYFRREWKAVLCELWEMVKKRRLLTETVSFQLAVGTVPAVIAGVALADFFHGPLRSVRAVAVFFILSALFFLYAEWQGKKKIEKTTKITHKNVFLTGVAQSLALIPGVSRLGMTIGAGMLAGLTREAAARFSFMLGAIGLLAANCYAFYKVGHGAIMPPLEFTLIGVGASFAMSLLSIFLLMKFLRNHSLRVFAFYLIILGSLMLRFLR